MISQKFVRSLYGKRKDIAYRILMYIGTHQEEGIIYQTTLALYLHLHYTTVNYHITRFRQEGLIDRQLRLTTDGFKVFKYLWHNVNKKVLRAHNIQVKFLVTKCPAGFPTCFSKSIYQPITNKKYAGIKTELNGFTLMFYSNKKIVCVLPEVYADTDEEISAAVQGLTSKLKEIIENEFEGVKVGGYELAKIQTMHVAVLKSAIAEKILLKGFTKENKDFAIDSSNGVPEVELTNPSNALTDIMDLVGLDKSLGRKRGLRAEPIGYNNDNRRPDKSK